MADPIVVRPGEGSSIQGPVGGPLSFKARGEQTGGSLTALENVIPPGAGPPLHTHANEDEFWWVIEGELRFTLGEELSNAPEGTFVFVPRGTPHNFQNVGEGPARIRAGNCEKRAPRGEQREALGGIEAQRSAEVVGEADRHRVALGVDVDGVVVDGGGGHRHSLVAVVISVSSAAVGRVLPAMLIRAGSGIGRPGSSTCQ